MRETGIGIQNPLFFIGVVENNVDERLEGRVQVRAFGVHGTVDQVPTISLPWATLIHGSYDPNSMLPPINSFVFGFFIDGRDAQQPMILGLIPTQMTEVLDPSITGWGNIPSRDGSILAKGSSPEDYGQPANSRLSRGENIDQTYVLTQEMSRIKNISIASDGLTEQNETVFEEPAPAYNAQYPYNRVIETAAHSIELDDTPGAERIMINHKSGSYISIDSRGTTVQKSISDKYEINDSHQHVYIGGKNYVTIMGDSRVLVQGNKIEEIVGDYTQIVHGNHMLSVAGQLNLNAGDEVQMRSAQLRLESNVGGINLKSAKGIFAESGESMNFKSGIAIFQEAKNSFNIKAGDNIFIEAGGDGNIKANVINMDEIINMANGDSAPATGAAPAIATELPEPAAKSSSTTRHRNDSSLGSSGYTSQDEGSISSSNADPAAMSIGSANASMDLITLIKSFEGFSEYPYSDFGQWSIGYGSFNGPTSSSPRNPGPISESDATELLKSELSRFINNVETINKNGNYNWPQESKDALVSFAYNIGSINQLTDNGNRTNAVIADKMLEYVNAGGVKVEGLVQRRNIEREKFLNGLAGTLPQNTVSS